ncbi:MAG: LL-diaminopimelate aminotransferase [Candidatus Omnitrophica bacterium]|nr:LL-diaminopimelate aminotransferase [Candidatus Omnitrophota bacterium]
MEIAERLKNLPPYLFAEIDKKKKQKIKEGKDIIDLGVGDPDTPTPPYIVDRLCEEVRDAGSHRYPSGRGLIEFRVAISRWYKKRFNVALDPESEILPLIGSKEGIAHMPLAFINQRDTALIPDPCYPPYRSGVILAGGVPYYMPLLEQNAFLPDLDEVDYQVAQKAKIIYLNYPNNPTGACATEDFFKETVKFAETNKVIVCHDAAYSELSFEENKPLSFLQIEGAKDVGVEFHSLSKTFNMTGWRVGFACGRPEIIAALGKVKENIDSGVFEAIQRAGIEALEKETDHLKNLIDLYRQRRDVLVEGLGSLGWKVLKPRATFYVWIPVPPGYTSMELADKLLEKASVVVTPGVGFGDNGEGYIRIALTVNKERIEEAVERIAGLHE